MLQGQKGDQGIKVSNVSTTNKNHSSVPLIFYSNSFVCL